MIRPRVYLILGAIAATTCGLGLLLGWGWDHVVLPCFVWAVSLWAATRWGAFEAKNNTPPTFPPEIVCPRMNIPCGMTDTWIKVGGDLLMVLSFPPETPKIVFVGPGFKRDVGLDNESLVGRNWEEFIHPDDLEVTRTELARGGEVHFTNRWRHQQHPELTRWVWLEWDVQVVPELRIIYAHARNMTNRFERESQMQTWARITSDLMATADTAVPIEERKFEWVNEAWSKALGWTPQELYSMRIIDLLDPSYAEPVLRERRTRETNRESPLEVVQQECAVRCKGEPPQYKTYTWMSAVINGVLYTSGRNIDPEIEHREELQKAIADLQLRNADLERFASIAAHQLRSPPRTITGIVQALEEDYGHLLDTEGLLFLKDIRDDAEQMAEVVDGLYRFSKVRTQKEMTLEPVNLGTLMAEIQGTLAKQGILRSQDIIDWGHLPVIWGEKVLLFEVFKNLIENGLKFNESPVKIIEIDAKQRPRDYRWEISVHDNGIGIDPKYQHKVFQMFQRMHPQYKGTGVGLALVAAIVQKMGGEIHLQSEVGKGTTFTFDFEARPEGL